MSSRLPTRHFALCRFAHLFRDMGKSAAQKKAAGAKNWRCEPCGNTDNLAHWKYCGRPSCGKPWVQQEQQQKHTNDHKWTYGGKNWWNDNSWGGWGQGWGGGWDANDTADEGDAATQRKLREARDTLKMLSSGPAKLPDDHPTIAEYTQLVDKLERELERNISTEDRLRDLLAAATTKKSDKDWADNAVGKAVVALRETTKTLKDKMMDAEVATAAFNANTLEIAELTRPAATSGASTPTTDCPIQAFRAQIDKVDPQLLVQHGATGDKLAEFFRIFANVNALVHHVTPVDAVEPAPTELVAPAAADVHAAVAPAPLPVPEPVTVVANTAAPAAAATVVESILPTTKKVRKLEPTPGQPDRDPMAVDETIGDFSDEEGTANGALLDAQDALAKAGNAEPADKNAAVAVVTTTGGSSG